MSKVEGTGPKAAAPAAPAPPTPEKKKAEARKVIDQAMKQGVGDSSSDNFVREKVTNEVLQHAKPEEKAHMLKQLMDGPTTGGDEQAMLRILKTVGDKKELDTVMKKAGGGSKVLGELEEKRDSFMKHLATKGKEGAKMSVDMITAYKPSSASADDMAVKYASPQVLAESTPDQKAHMLKGLMHGDTPASDEQAMLRILQSGAKPKDALDMIDKAGGAGKVLGELGQKRTGELVGQLKKQGAAGNRAVVDLAMQQKVGSGDADDFVQKHVDKNVLAQATPKEKVHMTRQLLAGDTGKADEQKIVHILNSAKNTKELATIVSGAGKNWLAKDVDDSKLRKVVESKIFKAESSQAPPYSKLGPKTTEAQVDKKLESFEKFLDGRKDRYNMLKGGGGDKTARFKNFYRDLSKATTEDLKQLDGWKDLSKADKVTLYNRVSHEAHVELKHNVNLTYGSKKGRQWSHREMTDIDKGLSKLPAKIGLENEKLFNLRRYTEIIDDGSKVAAWAKGNGDIEFSDIGAAGPYRMTGKGVSPVAETIIHEVGHHFDDENPKWKGFQKISGWNNLGSAKSSSLTKFKDGRSYTGKALGLSDEKANYTVTRRYGNTYVYKNTANFMGNYAKSNPLDDFSESMAHYFYDPTTMKTQAPDKYKFMQEWVKTQE